MDGTTSGGTSRHEAVHLQPAPSCRLHDCSGIICKAQMQPLQHIRLRRQLQVFTTCSPFGRRIHSCKLFLILTKPKFLMHLPFFAPYRNRKSQKTTENQAFQGHLPRAACPTEGHSHNRCIPARGQPGKPGLFCNIRSYSG